MIFLFKYFVNISSNRSEIRKIDLSGTLVWSTDFEYRPTVKSMTIDSTESSLYLATYSSPVIVASFMTSTGTVITSYSM